MAGGGALAGAWAGAGVGGGVHHGDQVFELVRGGEDFQVLQAVPGFAEEGALELAEQFLGGFGAVLVQRLGPAAADPGQEVGVVLGRGAGQGVLHRRRGLGEAGCAGPGPGRA